MRKYLLLSGILVLALLLAACGSNRKKTEEVDRMLLLEQQISRIAADLTELQLQSRQNGKVIEQLQEGLSGGMSEVRGDTARLSVKLDELQAKMQTLSERVEDSELRLGNIRRELNGLRYSRYNPYARPADRDAADNAVGDAVEDPEVDAGTPAGEAEAYQAAYADYLRGEYDLAMSSFREFLRSFPASDRADDAQYFVGECLYNIGDYESAVEEFDTIIFNYPDSQYKVSATYKKALSFLNSNQTAQGVILLQQLIREFPNTNEARLAQEQLRTLGLQQ